MSVPHPSPSFILNRLREILGVHEVEDDPDAMTVPEMVEELGIDKLGRFYLTMVAPYVLTYAEGANAPQWGERSGWRLQQVLGGHYVQTAT